MECEECEFFFSSGMECEQCNPKDICGVALLQGWKGKTLDASALSRFLVAEAEHRAVVFRERAEAGADLCGLEDFVCVRRLLLALAGVDVRTHFLSSPGLQSGGHTMVMVNEGPWRISDEGGGGKWPVFQKLLH